MSSQILLWTHLFFDRTLHDLNQKSFLISVFHSGSGSCLAACPSMHLIFNRFLNGFNGRGLSEFFNVLKKALL